MRKMRIIKRPGRTLHAPPALHTTTQWVPPYRARLFGDARAQELLADCIAEAMANRTLPAPPAAPYLNPVEIEAPPSN